MGGGRGRGGRHRHAGLRPPLDRPRRQAHRAPALASRGDRLDPAHPPRRAPLPRGRGAARRGAGDQAHRRRTHRHQGRQARQVRGDRPPATTWRRGRRGVSSDRHGPLRARDGSTGSRGGHRRSTASTRAPRSSPRSSSWSAWCRSASTRCSACCRSLLFPVVLAADADLPLGFLGQAAAVASPFALVVGVFNPLLDHEVVVHVGGVAVTGGWVSFASIIAALPAHDGRRARAHRDHELQRRVHGARAARRARRLRRPSCCFLYRYIFVLGEEAMRMARARALRSFGGRGHGACASTRTMLGQPAAAHVRARAARSTRRCSRAASTAACGSRRRCASAARDVVFMLGWSARLRRASASSTSRLLLGDSSRG